MSCSYRHCANENNSVKPSQCAVDVSPILQPGVDFPHPPPKTSARDSRTATSSMEIIMIKLVLLCTILVLMLGMVQSMTQATQAGKADGPNLAHMVYFSLKDNSPAAAQKLVDACNKYLSKHEGEVYF